MSLSLILGPLKIKVSYKFMICWANHDLNLFFGRFFIGTFFFVFFDALAQDRKREALVYGRKETKERVLRGNLLADVGADHQKEDSDWLLVVSYRKAKIYKQAMGICYEALRKNPNDFKFGLELFYICIDSGKFKQAIHVLKQQLIRHPNQSVFHYVLGRFMYKSFRGPALMALLRSQILDPNQMHFKENRAYIHELLKRNDRPDKYFYKAEALKSMHVVREAFLKVDQQLSTYASIQENQINTPKQLVYLLDVFFEALAQSASIKRVFYGAYYVPYYLELYKKGFTEALVYVILYREAPESILWCKENRSKVDDFLSWNETFVWK